jgi:DNA modification methylase
LVRKIKNDDLTADQLLNLLNTVYKNCAKHSVPGAAIYSACPAGDMLEVAIVSFKGSGFDFHWQLVWVKDQLVLGRGDYHFKHENILYGWKGDAGHYFTDDRTQCSVFEYARPKVSDEHPTMKPVELVEHQVRNSSKEGDILLEPFCGSGTTILACERSNRRCRAIELVPAYIAVTLQRYLDMTGSMPVMLEDGI